MQIHSVPVHQLLNYYQLTMVAGQKEAVQVILYMEVSGIVRRDCGGMWSYISSHCPWGWDQTLPPRWGTAPPWGGLPSPHCGDSFEHPCPGQTCCLQIWAWDTWPPPSGPQWQQGEGRSEVPKPHQEASETIHSKHISDNTTHTDVCASKSAFIFSMSSLTMWRCPYWAALSSGVKPACRQTACIPSCLAQLRSS